jgi:hypothetical protein
MRNPFYWLTAMTTARPFPDSVITSGDEMTSLWLLLTRTTTRVSARMTSAVELEKIVS